MLYTDHWRWCAGGLERGVQRSGGQWGRYPGGKCRPHQAVAVATERRGEAGHPGAWGEGEACPLPSCPGLTGEDHLSQAAPATPGLQGPCPCAGTRRDELRLLGLGGGVTEAAGGVAVGLCGAVGVPRLGPGSGLLGFLGSAEVSALRRENAGPVPQLWKGAHPPPS